jgi:hypothetical protein
MAHQDQQFQLLVACVFLNRTKGDRAIPVARRFLDQYPTPEELSTASYATIKVFFEHLGLPRRATWLIELAKEWLKNPPQAGRLWQKIWDGAVIFESEVAHLKGVGPYANDAWRIFCKDKMYEKAGVKKVKQEWRTVKPKDKELRSYLIWRWAKEGFDWDPETGMAIPKAPNDDLNLALSRLTLSDSSTSCRPKVVRVYWQGGSLTIPKRILDKAKSFDTGVKTTEDCYVDEINSL